MKRAHMPDVHAAHPNVTPLIDIVMCLIIFFMLVAKIGVATGAEAMELPETILGAKIEDMGNTLTLNVRTGPLQQPHVTALVNGEQRELKLVEPGGGRPLFEVLKALRESNENFKVIIRGEREMHYRYLEPILLTSAEAGVTNVSFNTAKVTKGE